MSLKVVVVVMAPVRNPLPSGLKGTNPIPSSISEVAELVFDQSTDEAWAQGAAVVALRELYESPWGTTGPASSL